MSRSRSLLMPVKAAPSAQEIALRPELVKQMLATASSKVNEMGIEHAVIIGLTDTGSPHIFHTYGDKLPLEDVIQLLEDLATMGRAQLEKTT